MKIFEIQEERDEYFLFVKYVLGFFVTGSLLSIIVVKFLEWIPINAIKHDTGERYITPNQSFIVSKDFHSAYKHIRINDTDYWVYANKPKLV